MADSPTYRQRMDDLRSEIRKMRNIDMTERLSADQLRWATAYALDLVMELLVLAIRDKDV